MIEADLGRDTCVIAVGGGVVTDLAGFVAGTFTRGVPFVTCPTTLLAAADASIGGKTGVDTPAATNLIGVFHQPVAVFVDLTTWRTLPAAQIRTGLAETVKHACLGDARLFEVLEDFFVVQGRSVLDLVQDADLCEYIAVRNCEIKKRFVTADVHESDERMVLNLGHTFGRALEAADNYRMGHGEAVAVGLYLQAELGLRRGLVDREEVDRMCTLLTRIGLPTEVPSHVGDDLLLAKTLRDKKVRRGQVRFVFQRGIGDHARFNGGTVGAAVDQEELRLLLRQSG
jgi:3-dehydroquinate synthase